jgi:predicted deacylase
MTLSIGETSVSAGEKSIARLAFGEHRDGTEIEQPVLVLNGEKDGPTLWVQACIHGYEYISSVAILDVWQELKPSDVAGAVVFAPALNVTAFRHEQRGSPLEKSKTLDMNRVFPGDKAGTFTEQAANHIFQVVLNTADYVLDIHTGKANATRWSLYSAVDEVADEAEQLGQALGFPYLIPAAAEDNPDALPLSGSLFINAAQYGIPGVIIESGGKGPGTESARADAVTGIYNLASELDMVDKVQESIEDETVKLPNWAAVQATSGGRLICECEPLETFKEDEVIGRIEDLNGDTKEEIRGPFDGVVLMSNDSPFIHTGEPVFQLGDLEW